MNEVIIASESNDVNVSLATFESNMLSYMARRIVCKGI